MIIIGLTGSIGMGKSTAAAMLRELGVPVHEADAEVHNLLESGGKGAIAVAAAFPPNAYAAIYKSQNSVDRKKLGEIVFHNDQERIMLESILHPLVREAQDQFIRHQKSLGHNIAVLDIPLLFETGRETALDYTIVVTAPYFIQKMRVLSRPGMSEEKFWAILKRQMPDVEKRARADFIVHTGLGRAYTMRQLKSIFGKIKKAGSHFHE